MTKNIFITAKPGIGKTTLIREITLPYLERIGGFYTEEIREKNKRKGFVLKTFSGQEGIMALKGIRSEHKLNKYGIDMKVIEGIGVNSLLEAVEKKDIVVIDEIGTMECISQLFNESVVKCLNSEKRILATIRYNSQPFSDEIKKMSNTKTLVLTRENYPDIKTELQKWLGK